MGRSGITDGPVEEARFDAPSAVAVGPDGTIFVSDVGSGRIRKISADGSTVTTLCGLFQGALGLDVDTAGRLYIANTDAKEILRYELDNTVTTIPTAPLGKPSGLQDPNNETFRLGMLKMR